jgi:hypothetical protein
VVGCIFLVNLPLIAVALAGHIAPCNRIRVRIPPAGFDFVGALLSMAGVGLPGHAVIEAPTDGRWPSSARSASSFCRTQCFQVILCCDTLQAGLSILPFSCVGNGLDRRDRIPGLVSAWECVRSLPVS